MEQFCKNRLINAKEILVSSLFFPLSTTTYSVSSLCCELATHLNSSKLKKRQYRLLTPKNQDIVKTLKYIHTNIFLI